MNDPKELVWDKLLKIKTTGRDDSHADQYHYPYEPTPYGVLERLAGSGYIGKKNTLADYGCGKGRVDFYLSYQVRCKTIGIEYDKRIYAGAIENQRTAVSSVRTRFRLADALLFFYYPSDEYVSYLMTQDQFLFWDEIDCTDLFPGKNPREKILIFRVHG